MEVDRTTHGTPALLEHGRTVSGDAPERELDALCLNSIARFKRPKAYVRVDSLPKNNYGKILKTELRALDSTE